MIENPHITISEVVNELKITTKAVKKHLANLKAKKIVRRIGPDKGGHWQVYLS